jgi:Transglycosylase SLT domain
MGAGAVLMPNGQPVLGVDGQPVMLSNGLGGYGDVLQQSLNPSVSQTGTGFPNPLHPSQAQVWSYNPEAQRQVYSIGPRVNQPVPTAAPASETSPAAPASETSPAAPTSSADSSVPSQMMSLSRFQGGILAAEGWHPGQAPSSAGAVGPWQLTPGTARDPGFGIPGITDPYDLHQNNQLGLAYSQKMFDTYGPVIGAAAYNWGPGNMDKYIAKMGDPRKDQVSWNKFLGGLPGDVRGYIGKVAGGQMAIPGQDPPSTAQTAAAAGGDPKNPFVPPPMPDSADPKKMMLMMAMQSMLPKGFAFHPVDYDPIRIFQAGKMPVSPGSFEAPQGMPRVRYGSGMEPSTRGLVMPIQPATGPGMVPEMGRRMPSESRGGKSGISGE